LSNGIVFTGAHAEVADLGPEIIGLSAYGNQSCMNSKEGEVWCWGQSPSLGTGRDGDTATPHKVYAITDSVKVETGGEFACSLGKNGTIKCWGKNNLGQTGNASQEFKDVYFPEFVAIAMNNVDITLGESHGCALNSLEEVWCWGDNKFGQMGDRIHPTANLVQTKQFSSIPRRVEIPEKIKAIDSGSFHTCALTYDSFVYCWGAYFSGQLGTGMSGVSISTPKIVPALSKVNALSAGYNSTCAKSQEQFYCWGEGSDGQLGESESFDRPLPRSINRSISSVILGPRGACGIESKAGIGSLVCWGKNSGYEPTSAVTTSAAIGDLHGCLITVSKTLNCWGSSQYGQTGQGTSSSSFIKSTIVTGIPQWRNYISSWSVVYKNDVAVISWSGAA
jgi:alpha-tubulin suppressor-like RCC1 family protein